MVLLLVLWVALCRLAAILILLEDQAAKVEIRMTPMVVKVVIAQWADKVARGVMVALMLMALAKPDLYQVVAVAVAEMIPAVKLCPAILWVLVKIIYRRQLIQKCQIRRF